MEPVDSKDEAVTLCKLMELDERPRRTADMATLLAGEPLDSYSHHELGERIALLEAEIARVTAHRDKAAAHRRAADALFGSPPPEGSGS
jgi:uncharacterized small protein (DUF1192 family)